MRYWDVSCQSQPEQLYQHASGKGMRVRTEYTQSAVNQSATSLDSRQYGDACIYLYNAQDKKERKTSELTDQSVTQSSTLGLFLCAK